MEAPTVPAVTDELIEVLERATGYDHCDVPGQVIAALLAERAALKRALSDADAAHMMYAEQVVELNQQLAAAAITAENCELFRMDAERYRWLRDNGNSFYNAVHYRGAGVFVDAAVDVARAIADT